MKIHKLIVEATIPVIDFGYRAWGIKNVLKSIEDCVMDETIPPSQRRYVMAAVKEFIGLPEEDSTIDDWVASAAGNTFFIPFGMAFDETFKEVIHNEEWESLSKLAGFAECRKRLLDIRKKLMTSPATREQFYDGNPEELRRVADNISHSLTVEELRSAIEKGLECLRSNVCSADHLISVIEDFKQDLTSQQRYA